MFKWLRRRRAFLESVSKKMGIDYINLLGETGARLDALNELNKIDDLDKIRSIVSAYGLNFLSAKSPSEARIIENNLSMLYNLAKRREEAYNRALEVAKKKKSDSVNMEVKVAERLYNLAKRMFKEYAMAVLAFSFSREDLDISRTVIIEKPVVERTLFTGGFTPGAGSKAEEWQENVRREYLEGEEE